MIKTIIAATAHPVSLLTILDAAVRFLAKAKKSGGGAFFHPPEHKRREHMALLKLGRFSTKATRL